MNIDKVLSDPKVQRALKVMKENNKSDPFVVRRAIAHLKSGILTVEELVGKDEAN